MFIEKLPPLSSTRVDRCRVAWPRTRFNYMSCSVVCNSREQRKRRERERESDGERYWRIRKWVLAHVHVRALRSAVRVPYIRARRERISRSSRHTTISPRFIPEKALIKGATVRPVSVAMKAAAGSPHEIAISRGRGLFLVLYHDRVVLGERTTKILQNFKIFNAYVYQEDI